MFVRQDIPIQHQIVQSAHAVLHIGSSAYPIEGVPNIILIGVPHLSALKKTEKKLADNGIPHHPWTEPDNDLGFTAIATVPLTAEEKKCLANYRLWSPMFSGSSVGQSASSPLVGRERSDVRFVPGEPVLEISAGSLAAQSSDL